MSEIPGQVYFLYQTQMSTGVIKDYPPLLIQECFRVFDLFK